VNTYIIIVLIEILVISTLFFSGFGYFVIKPWAEDLQKWEEDQRKWEKELDEWEKELDEWEKNEKNR
jgi:hypothetical protein